MENYLRAIEDCKNLKELKKLTEIRAIERERESEKARVEREQKSLERERERAEREREWEKERADREREWEKERADREREREMLLKEIQERKLARERDWEMEVLQWQRTREQWQRDKLLAKTIARSSKNYSKQYERKAINSLIYSDEKWVESRPNRWTNLREISGTTNSNKKVESVKAGDISDRGSEIRKLNVKLNDSEEKTSEICRERLVNCEKQIESKEVNNILKSKKLDDESERKCEKEKLHTENSLETGKVYVVSNFVMELCKTNQQEKFARHIKNGKNGDESQIETNVKESDFQREGTDFKNRELGKNESEEKTSEVAREILVNCEMRMESEKVNRVSKSRKLDEESEKECEKEEFHTESSLETGRVYMVSDSVMALSKINQKECAKHIKTGKGGNENPTEMNLGKTDFQREAMDFEEKRLKITENEGVSLEVVNLEPENSEPDRTLGKKESNSSGEKQEAKTLCTKGIANVENEYNARDKLRENKVKCMRKKKRKFSKVNAKIQSRTRLIVVKLKVKSCKTKQAKVYDKRKIKCARIEQFRNFSKRKDEKFKSAKYEAFSRDRKRMKTRKNIVNNLRKRIGNNLKLGKREFVIDRGK